MRIALALAASLLLPATLRAQQRWALEIRGPATVERGELRQDQGRWRLLLESSDTAWAPVADLRIADGRVSFTAPQDRRSFDGTARPFEMDGAVRQNGGIVAQWRAEMIQPGTVRWPVRPRVAVRQLLIGHDPAVTIIPAAWAAALPDTALVRRELDALATATSLPAPTAASLDRAQFFALGLDPDGRRVSALLLARIAASPAADTDFRRLFGANGTLRASLDLHDFAMNRALALSANVAPLLARALPRFVGLQPFDPSDAGMLRVAAWSAWQRARHDSTARAAIDSLDVADHAAALALRTLVQGYEDGMQWWLEAVQWLLTHRWIETPTGWRAPVDLVAAFWGRADLRLPRIEAVSYGAVQAVPVIGAGPLGARLVVPRNAAAAEFLAGTGYVDALDVWRGLEPIGPLTFDLGARSWPVAAPSEIARARLGGFLAGRDAIRIEPGILPLIAVGTIVHEWQHLLFEGARLEGRAPGLVETPAQLQLLDGSPWLAEGGAEWATERTLSAAKDVLPLLLFMEAQKRASIARGNRDDPHALGYLLVRAAADRTAEATLRDRLVRLLHDPAAFARESRLDGGAAGVAPLRLSPPATRAVIPEITFTWDDGVAEHLVRRLRVPTTPPEP